MLKDNFITAARAHHLSSATELSYLSAVNSFINWLKAKSDYEKRTPTDHLKEFLSDLANRKASASSQNLHFHAIRFLYEKVRGIPLGDLSDIPKSKVQPRIVQVPDDKTALKLVNAVDGVSGLALKLIYGTGGRLSDILKLRIKNLDFTRKLITIENSKGGKSRLAPMPKSLVQPLKALIADRDGEQFLFPSTKVGQHLHVITVQRAFGEAKKKVAVTKNYTVHSLRHAAAQYWERNGVARSQIQALLGHSHSATTDLYLTSGIKSVATVPTPI